MAAKDQKKFEDARSYLNESLTLLYAIGDKRLIAYALEAMAGAAAGTERPEDLRRAARLWGAAEALRAVLGAPMPPNEQAIYEQGTAHARAALGNEIFAASWTEGSRMTLEQAVEYALWSAEKGPS